MGPKWGRVGSWKGKRGGEKPSGQALLTLSLQAPLGGWTWFPDVRASGRPEGVLGVDASQAPRFTKCVFSPGDHGEGWQAKATGPAPSQVGPLKPLEGQGPVMSPSVLPSWAPRNSLPGPRATCQAGTALSCPCPGPSLAWPLCSSPPPSGS